MRILLLVALTISGFLSANAQNPSEPLFNRVNLDGWKIYGSEKWYVSDSLLVYEGSPDKQYGYLGTAGQYGSFIMDLEIAHEPNEKCMVAFRSTIEGTKISEWQVQVTLLGKDARPDYKSYGPDAKVLTLELHQGVLLSGIWNDLRIQVIGNHATTWLNDQKMSDFVDENMGEGNGFVSLQVLNGQNAKIFWRNIAIQRLPKSKIFAPSVDKDVKK